MSHGMSWVSDLGLGLEPCKEIFLVSLELKPDHCIVFLSLWGKHMSESPLPRPWEEEKKTLVPFLPSIVQNSMGKDLVWLQ